MSRDIKFFMICNNCSQKAGHPTGNVNHNYQPIFKNNIYMGIRLDYKCFDCNETESKEVLISNPNHWRPKDKEDFQKKMGIKKQVVN